MAYMRRLVSPLGLRADRFRAAKPVLALSRQSLHTTSALNALERTEQQDALLSRNDRAQMLPLLPDIVTKRMGAAGSQVSSLEEISLSQAISKIVSIKQSYLKRRYAFVESRDMILILLGLGASREDILKLPPISNTLEDDPTLLFRKTQNCRFSLDFETNSVRRLEFQPFILSEGEDFKRHDTGKFRHFKEIQNDLQCNTALQALLIFKALLVDGVETIRRRDLDYEANKWVCTLFHVRTTTTPEMLGEPALEGIHSDGVDHTMTTFLGASNMHRESAATYLHAKEETTGIQLQDASPLNILARVQHTTLLDTLIVADNERKHSVSSLHPEVSQEDATRDMLVFFTRRPYNASHYAASVDSMQSHTELPMEIPLGVIGHRK